MKGNQMIDRDSDPPGPMLLALRALAGILLAAVVIGYILLQLSIR
jgi:hypothetical protein